MKTVSLWRMDDDDDLDKRNMSTAVDAAAVDPGPNGPAHTPPEDIEDIFSGEQVDGEVDIFSGKEGHELFVRLLMEVDESMGLDFN